MPLTSELSQSPEYLSFRSSVPLKHISVDSGKTHGWRVYDAGPRTVTCPLVCLTPVSGTSDVYFRQILALSAKGYRVIAAEQPPYWTVREWCEGFKRLLNFLQLNKVHLFGSSIGGFLAQKFAEHTYVNPIVASMVLCNTFTDTSVFTYTDSAAIFWMLPSLILKKMVMGNFPTHKMDKATADSVDFMVERLESLNQQDLASRLTLNCTPSHVDASRLGNVPTTVLDVFDESALSETVRDALCSAYPQAKLAHLKTGGNFPFLSRSDEVNLHLEIHLRPFRGTNLSACEE